MNTEQSTRDAAHFQRLYDADPDPWGFRTSRYEQAKYRRTIEALGPQRFVSGFEAGCSVGVLTRMLASRCDALLAVDIVEQPLRMARAACANQPWVRFGRMQIPGEWPAVRFDLIVLSEVLYFLSPIDIAATADHAATCLGSNGVVVLVNWRGRSGAPCTGDEAAEIFIDRARGSLGVSTQYREDRYRLDVLFRR